MSDEKKVRPAAKTAIRIASVAAGGIIVGLLVKLLFFGSPWFIFGAAPQTLDMADGHAEYIATLSKGWETADVRGETIIYTNGREWGAVDFSGKTVKPLGKDILCFDEAGSVTVTDVPYLWQDRVTDSLWLMREDNLTGAKGGSSMAYKVGDAIVVTDIFQSVYKIVHESE